MYSTSHRGWVAFRALPRHRIEVGREVGGDVSTTTVSAVTLGSTSMTAEKMYRTKRMQLTTHPAQPTRQSQLIRITM
jgi:hypothetical protein